MHGLFGHIVFPGRRTPEPSLLRTHPPTEERIRRLLSFAEHNPRIPERFVLTAHSDLPLTRHTRVVSRRPRRRFRSGLWY